MADNRIVSKTPMSLDTNFSFNNDPKFTRQQNYQKDVDDVMKKYGLWIMRSLIRVFAQTAARFTPPNMGKSIIDEKYYFRPILGLIKLVRGEYRRTYATPLDKEMIKQGYRFKVLNTKYKKHQKGEAFAYTKDLKEAQILSRIENRGLARYSWSGAINNKAAEYYEDRANQFKRGFVEVQLPQIFKRLQRKSPHITKFNFAKRAMTYRQGVINVQITNMLAQSERYCQIAVAQGGAAVDRWKNKFFNAVKNQCQEDIVKILKKTKLSYIKFVAK